MFGGEATDWAADDHDKAGAVMPMALMLLDRCHGYVKASLRLSIGQYWIGSWVGMNTLAMTRQGRGASRAATLYPMHDERAWSAKAKRPLCCYLPPTTTSHRCAYSLYVPMTMTDDPGRRRQTDRQTD